MAIFERCPLDVERLALSLIHRYGVHEPLHQFSVRLDLAFARAETDEKGEPIGFALKKNGIRALGIARKTSLKERAFGRAEVEIVLDGDWWKDATAEEQAALLDHELQHVSVKMDKTGHALYDDLGKVQIKMRQHDYDLTLFTSVAHRHGAASQEQQQVRAMLNRSAKELAPALIPLMEHRDQAALAAVELFAKSEAKPI
jgi:hypothetical protein